MSFFSRLFFSVILVLFSMTTQAQAPSTFYYQTYLDVDGNTATGCFVIVPDNFGIPQLLQGVDASLKLTVTHGVLVSAERFGCSGGTLVSMGVDSGHPGYTLGGAFIEYRLPNVTLTPASTIGFAASTDTNFGVPSDVMFTSGGNPISLAPLLTRSGGTTVPVPLTSPGLLLLIAIAFGLIAARTLRASQSHRIVGVLAFVICLASASSAVISASLIILDGNDNDWAGVPALATDPAGDAPYPEIDLLRAYGVYQGSDLYLKLDLAQKPANDITPPPQPLTDFRILGANVTEPNASQQVNVSGAASQIRGAAASVRIENIRTGQSATAALIAGHWQSDLPAQARDRLKLTPISADSTEGGAIEVTVQGTAQEPTLPPNPAAIAPTLDSLLPYTVYDSTKFLYTNNPPVQIGVDPDTIKPKTASLLVGKVLDRQNQQLAGVAVRVRDHDEYGHTLSRNDGQWDLVVNGGTWFTVEYAKEGYLTVQRKIQVAWQDYGYLPDVVMIPLDEKVTVVDLRETAAESPAFQVHQGSISTDADGPRQPIVLFPKGVTAQMEMANGSTQAIKVLNVRATEYTVGANGPKAMPGELPPATGYTYAVELSVDQAIQAGAKSVKFSQPLPMYVDNFLNFPVGEIVPLGWYSQEQKAWVPDDNGRIVKVLAINNGVASLDIKGLSIAATATELAALGITSEELKAIADLYPIGKSFWRVPISHFTPWDTNWPWGPAPCPSNMCCAPPNPPDPDPNPPEPECPSTGSGCVLQIEARTMSEHIDIAGTPFTLAYSTTYAPGYLAGQSWSRRPLRDDKPFPETTRAISSGVRILGRVVSTFSGSPSQVSPNQMDEWQWDGKDRYGRKLTRMHATAEHFVNYEIGLVYYASSNEFTRSFAQYSGSSSGGAIVIGSRTAISVDVSNVVTTLLYVGEASSRLAQIDGLGLWTLDVLQAYDPVRHVLNKGNGTRRSQAGISRQLSVAENYSWHNGDAWYAPVSFTVLPEGKVLISAQGDNNVPALLYTLSEGGGRTVLPLTGLLPDSRYFQRVVYDATIDGMLLVDDKQRLFYRLPDGTLNWLAGQASGEPSGNGDFAPADIRFGIIGDVVRGHDGIVYVADTRAGCVRKLDTDGRIRTAAGICGQQNPQDAISGTTPALTTKLRQPQGLTLSASGTLLIADAGLWQVLKVGVDGQMSAIVGMGYRPDCLRVETDNPLDLCLTPQSLALATDGTLYIGGQNYIYQYDRYGHVSIIAGDISDLENTSPSYGPGSAPEQTFSALSTFLAYSGQIVALDGEKALYLKDNAGRVRKLSLSLPGFDGGDILLPEPGGQQAFRFNSHGQHQSTLDTLTGAELYRFTYDSSGRLASVVDADGRTTRIERSADGAAIVGPYGHRTVLTMENGQLIEIFDPAGAAWNFEYDEAGLMVKATNPNRQSNRYTYDSGKRLLSDVWPNGGGWTLSSVMTNASSSNVYQWERTTSITSGEGRQSIYHSIDSSSISQANWKNRWSIQPDGSRTATSGRSYGLTTENTHGDQTTTSWQYSFGDPRFGQAAAYTSSISNSLGGYEQGIFATSKRRWVELMESGQPIPVKRWGEDQWDNSSTLKSRTEYDHDNQSWTHTLPSGRSVTTQVDTLHRPLKIEQAGLPTTLYTYDQGRVSSIEFKPQDNEIGSRIWRNSYDAQGNLATVTDPLNRVVRYEYDAVGRPIKQTSPNGRELKLRYNAMGNLTSLVTPSGEEHVFVVDTMNDPAGYTPPVISNTATTYAYNKDRQLTRVSLPGGSALQWFFDATTGKLQKQAYSEGERRFTYGGNLQLSSVNEGSNTLNVDYQGVFPSGLRWQGEVRGEVRYYHDPSTDAYRYNRGDLTRLEVLGQGSAALRQKISYGADHEITAQSLMKLNERQLWQEDRKISFERDAQTLQLKRLKGWKTGDSDERSFNAFGEMIGYRYFSPAGQIIDETQVTVTGNDGPVDLIKVNGQLSLTGSFLGADKLWLTPQNTANDYLSPVDQWLAIESDGRIADRFLALTGVYGVPRPYTLSVKRQSDGPGWSREIGPITRRERTHAPISGVHALQSGSTPLLYGLKNSYNSSWNPDTQRWDYELNSEVTQVNPASGEYIRFRLQTAAGPNGAWSSDATLAGAGQGKVYVHHRGSWNCGETDSLINDCVTAQSDGAAELLGALPQARPGERQILRAIEGGREFYIITGSMQNQLSSAHVKAIPAVDIVIERWNAETNVRTLVARLPRGSSVPSSVVTQAETAGADLLLTIASSEMYEVSNTGAYLRIKPDGRVIEVPLDQEMAEERWMSNGVGEIFADGDNNCYLKKYGNDQPSEYVCRSPSGEEVQRSVLPPQRLSPATPATLKFNPTNRTLYVLLPGDGNTSWSQTDETLWQLSKPADRNSGLWRTVFEPIPIKTATVTVSGGLVGKDQRYEIKTTRDALGRISSKTETLENQTIKQSYVYDLAGRLVEVKTGEPGQEVSETWGYDANGNRTTHNGQPVASFDAQDRLLTQSGTSYEHNLMGQRTKKQGPSGTTTYRYDNLGNLRDVTLPDSTVISSAIDPSNRRIGRQINRAWTHKWLYLNSLNPVAELDSNDRVRKAFIYADKVNVPAYMLTFDESGNEIGQYRIVSDLLGSVRVVINLTNGDIVQQINYDVWGNIISDSNPGFQPFGFAGGLYDSLTKLTRFGARDYDAETGRWAAKDPINFDGGDTNLYGYVANDPVNWIDIFGLEVFVCNRKVDGFPFIGNHSYLWDSTTNKGEGMKGSSGVGMESKEKGPRTTNNPNGDACNAVQGSSGKEKEIMDFIKKNKHNGLWFPYWNDCHNAVQDAIANAKLENPGALGEQGYRTYLAYSERSSVH